MSKIFIFVQLSRTLRLVKMKDKLRRVFLDLKSEDAGIELFCICVVGFVLLMIHWCACALNALVISRPAMFDEEFSLEFAALSKLGRYACSTRWSLAHVFPAPLGIDPWTIEGCAYEAGLGILTLFLSVLLVLCITGASARLALRHPCSDRQLERIRSYLRSKDVSSRLQCAVWDSLEEDLKPAEDDTISCVLAKLPTRLRYEVQEEMFSLVLRGHPLFRCLSHTNPLLLPLLCRWTQSRDFPSDRVVFSSGEEARGMLFVISGQLEYIRGDVALEVHDGQWVCENALWLCSWIHQGQLVCKSMSTLILLAWDTFWQEAACIEHVRAYAAAYWAKIGSTKAASMTDACESMIVLEEICSIAFPRWVIGTGRHDCW